MRKLYEISSFYEFKKEQLPRHLYEEIRYVDFYAKTYLILYPGLETPYP